MNFLKIKEKIQFVFTLLSSLLFVAGLVMFSIINSAIFFNSTVVYIVVAIISVLLLGSVFIFFKKGKNTFLPNLILTLCAAVFLAVLIYNCLIKNIFQPLALTTETTIILIVACVVMLVSNLFGIIFKNRNALPSVVSVILIVTMALGTLWVQTQNFGKFSNLASDPSFIFENGEMGYTTFRIPSIISLNKNVINKLYNKNLKNDLLLATAEGRKNSSRDTGDVDLVGKVSSDGGKTWSKLQVYFQVENEVGKVGNPTPVFDEVNGVLNMVYLTATKSSGFDYRSYNVQGKLNDDFTFNWSEPILLNTNVNNDVDTSSPDGVNENTIMTGPGKSIQLKSGRLLIPCSNKGESFALYSDDFGKTWTKGKSAGTGNECEAVELPNGELLMVVRDNLGCSSFHFEQYQRMSYSKDGGETWYVKNENSTLKTPICMASLDIDSGNTVYFTYPNDFLTRANLSLATSVDNGETWQSKTLYSGAAGYSCVTVDSDNNVYVLAEIGKIDYNEALVFMKLEKSSK